MQEFLRSRDEEVHLIPTRCRPAEETGVFAPVREILGVTTLDELAERIGRMCSDDVECERVVAGLAESAGIATTRSLASLPAAEREDEIVQAWRRYVAMLGTDRLVILAVDDIHWADPSLVRLVDRLTFGGPRVLVVATARPEFANAAGIRPSGDRFFVELEGLEREDAERLAREAGAADERVIERAEGNPLFLVELARAGTDGADLPLTLQGALGARLDQLPVPDRVLLSLAAVAGERFTAADAAAVAERDPGETGRTLVRLADLHFLDLADAGYRFHHGLVRDVAYGRLLTAERMKAHARFARERLHPEDAESLAHHWWEALRPPDDEWVWQDDPDLPAMRREAFRAHLASGIRHGEHFATELAVEILGRALEFAHDDAERAAAERALGRTYRRILRQDEAWEHLTRALELQRHASNAPLDAYLDLIETAQWTGAFRRVPAEVEVTLLAEEGAAAARAAGDQAAIARILRAHATFLTNKEELDERAAGLIEAAVAAADASGDDEVRRRVLLTRSLIMARHGRPISSREFAALETSGDALERMSFLRMLADRHFEEGDLDESARRVAETRELAEPMGPHNRTHAYGVAAQLHKARGDWPEVIGLAQSTSRLVQENPSSAFCNAAAVVMRDGAIAHALAGRREEALALLQAMPTSDIEVDIVAMVPRALLGFPSPESDARLHARRWGWWEWEQAATRSLILRRPDAAEAALREMGPIVEHTAAQRAFAQDVREAIAELRGGPPASYDALTKIGFLGWVEILKRRVDAEY